MTKLANLLITLLCGLIFLALSGCSPAPDASPFSKDLMFVVRDGDNFAIYTVNHDGSGLARWQSGFKQSPEIAWSKDGLVVAVLGARGSDPQSIYITQRHAPNPEIVVALPMTMTSSLAWSPLDDELVFSARNADRERVYVVDLTDKQLKQLSSEATKSAWDPKYSPDGKWLTFTSSNYPECDDPVRCVPRISLMNLSTRKIQQISSSLNPELYLPKNECDVTWSPDSTEFVFRRGCDPGEMPYDLYIYDLRTGKVQPLLAPLVKETRQFGDAVLGWLPDSRILLRSDRTGQLDLLAVQADGSGLQPALNLKLKKPFNYADLDISADGTWMVSTGGNPEDHWLRVWNGQTSDFSELDVVGCEAKLSPSAQWIAYDKSSCIGPGTDNGLWVIDRDGKQSTKVSGSLKPPDGWGWWSWLPK